VALIANKYLDRLQAHRVPYVPTAIRIEA